MGTSNRTHIYTYINTIINSIYNIQRVTSHLQAGIFISRKTQTKLSSP